MLSEDDDLDPTRMTQEFYDNLIEDQTDENEKEPFELEQSQSYHESTDQLENLLIDPGMASQINQESL